MPCAEYYHSANMFCLQRYSIHYIPSMRAGSRRIANFRTIPLYFIILVLYIHLRHYLFQMQYLQRRNLGKNSNKGNDNNNYDGGSSGTVPDSARPSRTRSHPVFALSHIVSSHTLHPHLRHPSLLGVGNASSKANRRLSSFSVGLTSQQSCSTSSSLSSSPFELGGAGLCMTKMAGMIQADVGSSASFSSNIH